MSGVDELFAGADHPTPVPEVVAGSRRPGMIALVLGLVAFALNVSAALTLAATVVSQFGDGSAPSGALDWVPAFLITALLAAAVCGLVALIIGVGAVRRHRGRGPGIAGGVLGALAIATDVTIAVIVVVSAITVA
jgi:hypothetical protein